MTKQKKKKRSCCQKWPLKQKGTFDQERFHSLRIRIAKPTNRERREGLNIILEREREREVVYALITKARTQGKRERDGPWPAVTLCPNDGRDKSWTRQH